MRRNAIKQRKKSISLIQVNIAILIALLLTGCNDDAEQPILEPEIEPDVVDAPDVVNEPVGNSELINLSLKLDEHGIPHIVTHTPKIDPNEANIPLPELVIDVNAFVDNNAVELNRELGDPISVVAGEVDNFELRYCHLFDGNVVKFIVQNDHITWITIYYRRGYPTSLQAVKAAGFKEERTTLKKQVPEQIIHESAKSLAQDIYSAVTDTRAYGNISVHRTSKGVWFTVSIAPQTVAGGPDGIDTVVW